MRIGVGDMVAKCRRCGCEDFDESVVGDTDPQAVFICSACRAPTTRLLLLTSISDEAVKRSVDLREQSKRLRDGPESGKSGKK